MYWLRIFMCFAFIIFVSVWSQPTGRSEEVVEQMREIPQWHCLRYRKFDLVRRCRNYRAGFKSLKH